MQAFIDVITRAGHCQLDVVLYTLLPNMVVTTIALRFLEVYGVLESLAVSLMYARQVYNAVWRVKKRIYSS